jgi:peptidyl-prolyl cis-trans isomerase SurA
MATTDSAKNLLQFFENYGIPEEDITKINTGEKDLISVKLNSNSKKSLEYLYNKESALTLRVEESLFEKGDNQIVDTLTWENGRQEFEVDGTHYLVEINEILGPELKELNEVKGTVISDYQNYLEKTWIEELKRTFSLEINYNTLDQVKSSFKKKLHSSD